MSKISDYSKKNAEILWACFKIKQAIYLCYKLFVYRLYINRISSKEMSEVDEKKEDKEKLGKKNTTL